MPRLTFLLCVCLLFCSSCLAQGGNLPALTPGVTASLIKEPTAALPSPIPNTQTPTETLTPSPSPSAAITPVVTPITICASSSFIPIAFLPDNTHLLGRTETELRIIDSDTGQETSFLTPSEQVVAADLSVDGQILALALENHSIQLIRMSDKKVLDTLVGHLDRITSVKFSPAGDRLISASVDAWVRVWGIDGKLQSSFQPGGADNFPAEVLGIGISADGATLGTISAEGPLKLWDLSSNKKKAEFEGSISGGYDGSEVVFSKDGKFMAEGLGGGGQISLWSLLDGALLWRGGIFAIAFSPDARFFVYTDVDEQGNNIIVLLSADGKEEIRVLRGHPGPIWEVLFSPDGAKLASVDDSEMRLWRMVDGQLLYRRMTNCPASTPAPTISSTP
jgi:WD40 repeat protein